MSPRFPVIGELTARRVIHAVGLFLLVLVVYLVVASSFPALTLSDEAYVVRSDSMSPAIKAGSVVFVDATSPAEIEVGDVITYETGGAASNRVTHRVIEIQESGERRFRTKGDANEDPDPDSVSPAQVVGIVAFHVPLIGYLIDFAGSSLGLIAFVVIPAVGLVLLELWDIAKSSGSDGDQLR